VHWWNEYQWPAIGGLVLLTILLGHIGFDQYLAARGDDRSGWDVFYLALQLFTLESGAVSAPVPWELQVARLLAPVLVAYTAVKAVFAIFRQEAQLVKAHMAKDHVVIAGLGRKGLALASSFRQRGDRIVAIETDSDNSHISLCRKQRAAVLVGDASDPQILKDARVHRARYVFSVCADDGINAEIAVQTRALARENPVKPLTTFVHVADKDLAGLLREKEITGQSGEAFRLEIFNIYASGARTLLNNHPAFDEEGTASPHVVVVGLGRLGEAVVLEAARRWHLAMRKEKGELEIAVVDQAADERVARLKANFPRLAEVCKLTMYSTQIGAAEFELAPFLFDEEDRLRAMVVYVCLSNDAKGLSAALSLRQSARRHHEVPIIVRMNEERGLASLLASGTSNGEFEYMRPFVLLDRTCTPELLMGGTNEVLGRAIHEDYVLQQRRSAKTAADNPSMVPWEQLTEDLRESNRRQADHIGVKLNAIGCAVRPAREWIDELFQLNNEEIEQLARMEHDRWVEERRAAGWRYAEGPKNNERQTSPYLVDWDALSEEIKELDRNTVRGLPFFLAKAGFEIHRSS
jgi:hypothetical protein